MSERGSGDDITLGVVCCLDAVTASGSVATATGGGE
jgi:hypothetical protein